MVFICWYLEFIEGKLGGLGATPCLSLGEGLKHAAVICWTAYRPTGAGWEAPSTASVLAGHQKSPTTVWLYVNQPELTLL